MLFKINRTEFLKGINTIKKSIHDNKVRPVLSCAYMEAREQDVFFCGTDLQTTIVTSIPCDNITQSGRVIFQYQTVEEYVKELKDDVITISINETTLLIEGEDSSSEFFLLDANDYPKVPVSPDFKEIKADFTVVASQFANSIQKVKFAASVANDNIATGCVKLESEDNVLKMVATDTWRLAYLASNLDHIEKPINISIPLNAIDALVALLESYPNEQVQVYTDASKVYFKIGNTCTISNLAEYEFPNYKAVLENNKDRYENKLLIANETFTKILKRVIIFVKTNVEAKNGAIFTLQDKSMTVDGFNDMATISETSQVDYQGDELSISLNAKFILDFAQNIPKNDDVSMEFINETQSVRMMNIHKGTIAETDEGSSADNGDKPTLPEKEYVYILMPMSLKKR